MFSYRQALCTTADLEMAETMEATAIPFFNVPPIQLLNDQAFKHAFLAIPGPTHKGCPREHES